MQIPCPACGRRLWSEVESFGAFRTVVFFGENEESDARTERLQSCPDCGFRFQTPAIQPDEVVRRAESRG